MTDLDNLIWIKTDKNLIDVIIYVYIDPEVSKIDTISRQPIPNLVDAGLEEHAIHSRWSIPNRAEMESYRRASAAYNFQNQSIMVNEFILSDCVVSHHIETLSFDGKDVPLERDTEHVLEPSFLEKLKSLHTGIYDALYDKYRAEACI